MLVCIYRYRYDNISHVQVHRPLDPSLVYAHPDFRLFSYSGRDSLLHDLAIVRLRRGVRGAGGVRLAREGRALQGGLGAGRVVGGHSCDRGGLGPGQVCVGGNSTEGLGGTGELGEVKLDPRKKEYR